MWLHTQDVEVFTPNPRRLRKKKQTAADRYANDSDDDDDEDALPVPTRRHKRKEPTATPGDGMLPAPKRSPTALEQIARMIAEVERLRAIATTTGAVLEHPDVVNLVVHGMIGNVGIVELSAAITAHKEAARVHDARLIDLLQQQARAQGGVVE